MKKDVVQHLTQDFESFVHEQDGVEFWYARELQHLLGYSKWDNFKRVIARAKTACEISGFEVADHFADVGKMVEIGSGATKEIDDLKLTRYACYLIAQNGDSSKEQIAFAQTYFAVQTRKAEVIEKVLLESDRLRARKKLAETEKELSSVIFQQTKDNRNFAFIRSKGDAALFGKSTQAMKQQLKMPKTRALADFLPTILLKAKDFASEITIFNAKKNKFNTERQFSDEHITNNRRVRKTLLDRGIRPESLPAEEDIKKVERRLKSEEKKALKGKEKFKKKGDEDK